MSRGPEDEASNGRDVDARDGGEDQIPDGGYGWVCVLSCLMINCFTWGITASYGIYLTYYLDHDAFPGATPTDYGFIGGFNFSAAMIASPLVTMMTREYGKHLTMGLGVVFQAAGFASASVSKQIWQLYLSQGILVGLGIGFLYIPSTAILSQWFSSKRSLASGISAAGSGIGGAVFAWATGSMIERLSVAWALRITCFVGLVANSIATAMIRDRNKHIRPPQLALDTRLLTRVDVWLMLSWAFISMLGYIVLLYSLGDFAIAIGLSRAQSTNIIGVLNIGTAVGRPIIGIWSDRFRRIDVAAIITLVCGLSCFAFWVPATGYALTVFFALLIGAILGVFWMTIGPLCVEVAGLKNLPSLLSISWLSIAIPTAVSEVIALELRRDSRTFSYLYAQVFAGAAYLIAAALMFALAVVKRRQEQANAIEMQNV